MEPTTQLACHARWGCSDRQRAERAEEGGAAAAPAQLCRQAHAQPGGDHRRAHLQVRAQPCTRISAAPPAASSGMTAASALCPGACAHAAALVQVSSTGPVSAGRIACLGVGRSMLILSVWLRRMHLRIEVDIHSLQGTVCAWIPPPPNDRLWFGFVTPPTLKAEATPILTNDVSTLLRPSSDVGRAASPHLACLMY